MSHKTRVERHIIVDILAGILGASLVASLIGKSILAGLLALAAGVVLFFIERSNIKEEDTLEENIHPAPEPRRRALELTVKDVAVLGKVSSRALHDDIDPEGLPFYIAGLEDGAATQAQWVIDQLGVA